METGIMTIVKSSKMSRAYPAALLAMSLAGFGMPSLAQGIVGTALQGAANITGAALGGAAQITGAALGGAAHVTGAALGGAADVTDAALGGSARVTEEAIQPPMRQRIPAHYSSRHDDDERYGYRDGRHEDARRHVRQARRDRYEHVDRHERPNGRRQMSMLSQAERVAHARRDRRADVRIDVRVEAPGTDRSGPRTVQRHRDGGYR
jgi:hypothetical protein